mmetsp:Transcript_120641/g.336640  ORF Transcript_120641/g.336640 Transcript_120641/m.336640 type:complete len:252 (+) Transcript_120641:256-1011(+)
MVRSMTFFSSSTLATRTRTGKPTAASSRKLLQKLSLCTIPSASALPSGDLTFTQTANKDISVTSPSSHTSGSIPRKGVTSCSSRLPFFFHSGRARSPDRMVNQSLSLSLLRTRTVTFCFACRGCRGNPSRSSATFSSPSLFAPTSIMYFFVPMCRSTVPSSVWPTSRSLKRSLSPGSARLAVSLPAATPERGAPDPERRGPRTGSGRPRPRGAPPPPLPGAASSTAVVAARRRRANAAGHRLRGCRRRAEL